MPKKRGVFGNETMAAIICTNEYTTSATLDAIAEQAELRMWSSSA